MGTVIKLWHKLTLTHTAGLCRIFFSWLVFETGHKGAGKNMVRMSLVTLVIMECTSDPNVFT